MEERLWDLNLICIILTKPGGIKSKENFLQNEDLSSLCFELVLHFFSFYQWVALYLMIQPRGWEWGGYILYNVLNHSLSSVRGRAHALDRVIHRVNNGTTFKPGRFTQQLIGVILQKAHKS